MRKRKRRGAGRYNRLITFQRRQAVDDGFGNTKGDWEDIFTSPARLEPKLGGEATTAARLQGTQPHMMTIRSNTAAREVTPAWRAYDARNTKLVFDIKSAINPDERNGDIELLVVENGSG